MVVGVAMVEVVVVVLEVIDEVITMRLLAVEVLLSQRRHLGLVQYIP